MRRYAAKRDEAEQGIVDGLLGIGCLVERLDRPVDLAVQYRGKLFFMEVKTPGNHAGKKGDARQKAQAAFCRLWCVPYVRTLEEALTVVGAMGRAVV